MYSFYIILMVSTILCSLVAGFVFAFAVVVMPGIAKLSDRHFLQTFKAVDSVIQKAQPIFMIVWVGSIATLTAAAILSGWKIDGPERALITIATGIYLIGVQLPTATVNVPLNNQLQEQSLDSLSASAVTHIRTKFESRWIRWNIIRTVFAILTSMLLIFLLWRL